MALQMPALRMPAQTVCQQQHHSLQTLRQLVEDAGERSRGAANNGAGGAGVYGLKGAGAPAVIHAPIGHTKKQKHKR